jgi:hypothetical protein
MSLGGATFKADAARYAVAVEGLDALKDIEGLDARILRNGARAINTTADYGRTASARRILAEVNFPASYLNPSEGRLAVTKRAAGTSLSAIIKGRDRPTSLARFVRGSKRPFKPGVSVEVKPGRATFLKRAFIFPLRNGNLGLAVRTKNGPPAKAYKPKPLGRGLWLLYGPSVDQVFKSVRDEVAPDLGQRLEDEFNRLMDAGV